MFKKIIRLGLEAILMTTLSCSGVNSTYTVKPGDTFSKIYKKEAKTMSYEEFKKLNADLTKENGSFDRLDVGDKVVTSDRKVTSSKLYKAVTSLFYSIQNSNIVFTSPKSADQYDEFLDNLKSERFNSSLNSYNQRSDFLNSKLEELLSWWYGTKWDFYGTTLKPNEGSIACGHFVTTILHDLGFEFDFRYLGRQPASKIVNYFSIPQTVDWLRNNSNNNLESYLKKHKHGFYILGLDNHVGFVKYDDSGSYFIHSNPLFPRCVIKEPTSSSLMIINSKVLNIGKIFSNKLVDDYFFHD